MTCERKIKLRDLSYWADDKTADGENEINICRVWIMDTIANRLCSNLDV